MRRLLPLVGLLLVGVGVLPGCSSDGDRLVVYSGRSEDLIGPILSRFSEEQDVGIDVRYGDSADLALLIDEEGGQSPADVFISQSPGAVGYLDTRDRLTELPDAVLDEVDEANRAGDGRWVGLSGRVRTLVYNTELVDETDLPDSVLDLTDPSFEGEVAVAPSNGSFIDFVTAMRHELGDDEARAWLEGMTGNDAPTYANNVAIVQAVGRGEMPMGLVNHYYNVEAKAEDPDLPTENHYFPADGDLGALLLATTASKLRASDNDDAEALIRFLLSTGSQRYFAEETFEYPLVDGVEPAEQVPDLADLELTRIDLDELGGDLRTTQQLIADSGLADG